MPLDRFLIAPINTGLQTDVRPWQILDDSFSYLQNAYVFRGRVRKRFGTIQMGTLGQQSSRLRIAQGTLASPISPVVTNSGSLGQMFSIANVLFTVNNDAPGVQDLLVANGSATKATLNNTTGAFVFSGVKDSLGNPVSSGTTIYFYPANPVMGISQYLTGGVNNHPTYAFDTQFAYLFTGNPAAWTRSGTAEWYGNNLNFFQVTNWQGNTSTAATPPVMIVSNFNATVGPNAPADTDDPLWATNDGSTWYPIIGQNGFYFLPGGNPRYTGPYVQTALITVPFYNRLLLLNTIENDNSTDAISLGNTDGSGNASGTLAAGFGLLGKYFVIGSSTYTVVVPNGALSVSGTGSGTFNTSTGAYTFTGAPATTAIYYYSGNGNATQYPNRCRFSFNGSPFARNAWYEPNQSDSSGSVVNNNNLAAGAGLIDAATDEQIISAQFVKDRLIVYFERSTWEIAYTGNEVNPFRWQRLNTELGSMSTFSTVPFDKAILTIGASGVHACNASNVSRIDNKIPDNIFLNFSTEDDNAARVAGIRDYYTELVYWTYLDTHHGENQAYPNQILVYNYRDGSWAINDDCFTCFGYFEQGTDMTWQSSTPITWETANFTWTDNFTSGNHRQILCGTPTGWVLQLAETISRNAPSMQITNLSATDEGITTLTIINHNLDENPTQLPSDSDYILLEGLTGTAAALNGLIFQVQTTIDMNTITIITFLGSSDTYFGGGTAARVSNPQIFTKQFNPYASKDRSVYLQRVDFAVEKTTYGQITVDYYPSSSEVSMIAGGVGTGSIMGTGILETFPYNAIYAPLEQYQDLLWHPIYFQSTGEFIQLVMYLSDLQMLTPNIALSPFELQAMCLYTQPTSYRME